MKAPGIRILPYEPGDLARLSWRSEQHGDEAMLGAGAARAAELGPAYTIVNCPEVQRDLRVLCCAGLAESGADHATAWAVFAADIAPGQWGRIVRAMRGVLDACSYQRIDMAVRTDWPAARRFAAALGFVDDYAVMRRAPRETFLVEHEAREAA